MLVLKDDTNTRIIGALAHQTVCIQIGGLSDEGLPKLGYKVVMDENEDDTEMVVVNESLVFLAENGEQYHGNAVVDLRPDGTMVPYRLIAQVRYVTPQIKAAWRQEVAGGNTMLGFADWMSDITDREYLQAHGLYLNKRDWRINQDFEGAWQVAEFYQPGIETLNASEGPWAIVGDNPNILVDEAIKGFVAHFAE